MARRRRGAREAIPPLAPPGDLEALVADGDDFAVLSFRLPDGPPRALSPAESEVAGLVMAGRSNSEIAALRGTSARTVANQIASLFRKLDVTSRLQLVTRASFFDRRPANKKS